MENKETIVEAAFERSVDYKPFEDDLSPKKYFEQGFIEGAEYQAERMYSEEDMIEASKYGYNFHKSTQFPNQEFEDSCIRNTQQWLNQIKKVRNTWYNQFKQD
jgi:hypothetical protein